MRNLEIDQIYCGDSRDLLRTVEPASVALSFWSPPYFVGKDYEQGETYESWQELLKGVIQLHAPILKPGGFMVINIADILCFADPEMPRFQGLNPSNQRCRITKEMVLAAKNSAPKNASRQEIAAILGCSEQTVDRRLNGNNIRGGKHQVQTRVKLVGGALEDYAYAAGLYLYDKRIWIKDPAWANSRWTSNTLKAVSETEDLYIFWKPGGYSIDRQKLSVAEWKMWGSRQTWFVGSVRKNDDHSAKFPRELAERVIRLYSHEGDLVVDPFVGSGTTVVAAHSLGRHYIGIDKEPKYAELAAENLNSAKQQEMLPLGL